MKAIELIILILILAYSAPAAATTNSTLWRCDNKEYIAKNLLCNGQPDCSDGSDETAEYCIAGSCADNEFRCAYGACIPKASKCNYVKDCADNSDETEYLCFKNSKKIRKELQGSCPSSKQLQCKSGQCIPFRNRCDGAMNCDDGTDETVNLCSTIKCISYAFRCGYGACIHGRGKCNGIIDCADGSDEAVGLCGYKRKEISDADETEKITTDCLIPFRIKNLVIENETTNQTITYGGKVAQGATIKFRCKSNWKLSGVKEKKCIDAEWLEDWPTCGAPENLIVCQPNQWPCDDGTCIQHSQRCDGEIHCADESDERTETCGENQCSATSFRCNYGACVGGNAKCNGVIDCADKSDELPIMCEQSIEKKKNLLRGNCSALAHMQCTSGECIRRYKLCDGVPDCKDGSDETMNYCIHFKCSSYAFRCNYGGCIAGTGKCNGITDCVDGSDEMPYACSPPTKIGTPTTSKSATLNEIQHIIPPSSLYNDPPKIHNFNDKEKTYSQACTMPKQSIPHLIARAANTTMELRQGSQVNTDTRVYFRCENDWQLIGTTNSRCMNGNWAVALPRCEKYCSHSTLDKGLSTSVSCSYKDKASNCSAELPIGTRAEIACAVGYHLPASTAAESRQMNLTCDGNGEWDYSKFKCTPDCSSLDDSNTPWYVSIFQRTEGTNFVPICGGAIISPKMIISAVSCFTQITNSEVVANDPLLYNAVIGNYEDEYLEGSNIGMSVHKISEIVFLVPVTSNSQDYPDSIATLVVNNYIVLSAAIKPICFEFAIQAAQISLIETADEINEIKGSPREYEHEGVRLSVIVGDGTPNTKYLVVIDYFKLQLQHELQRYNYWL